MNKPVRIYIDTSVFGGVFDMEFAGASRRFFDTIGKGIFTPQEVIDDEDDETLRLCGYDARRCQGNLRGQQRPYSRGGTGILAAEDRSTTTG
jgi:hypothetical protein